MKYNNLVENFPSSEGSIKPYSPVWRLSDLPGTIHQWFRQHFGHNHPGKLGLTPGIFSQTKPLSTYVSGPLPPAPTKSMPFKLLQWGMYGNDRWGDCTYAAIAHCWMGIFRLTKQKWTLTSAQVVNAYHLYCAKYNDGKDNGAYPNIVLQNWRTTKMWGTILQAWANIDQSNLKEVEQVIAAYGCIIASVNLPKPAYTYQLGANYVTFKRPVWKLTGTPDDNVIIGAHEIAIIGYDTQYIYAVTWGIVVRITRTWWERYTYAANVLVVPGLKGFDGLNVASLIADLASLNP
jgi:hypothetical protein